VNPQPATGFTILMAFLRVGTVLVLMSQVGIAGIPAKELQKEWWGAGSFERPRAPLGERVSRVLLYA
jgi:hypothetical protein